MSRILFTTLASIAILSAIPAFAQNGSAMAGKNMGSDMPMTCQAMMDKQMPMMESMSSGSKKTMAMKEMNMAKMAMSKNDEKTCMMHMKKSMGMMGG